VQPTKLAGKLGTTGIIITTTSTTPHSHMHTQQTSRLCPARVQHYRLAQDHHTEIE
jgi:hypothetical protein